MGVTVDHDGNGLVVRKQADEPEAAARLAHEAAVLARAQHPGVVRLVDHLEATGDRSAVLVTSFAGNHTLTTAPPTSVASSALTVAAVAETVADLHTLGIAHRDLVAAHVVLDGDGRPRLCGFGRARGPGLDPPPDPTEPGPETSLRFDRGTDVYSLGLLLADLLDGGPDAPPWRRPRRLRRALESIVVQATGADPARRPSARALARALGELVGTIEVAPPPHVQHRDQHRTPLDDAAPTGDDAPPAPDDDGPLAAIARLRERSDFSIDEHRRRWPAVTAAAVGLGLLGLAAALAIGGSRSPSTADRRSAEVAEVRPTEDAPGRGCPPAQGTTADVDGDGCDEGVVVDGAHVRAGERVYRIGEPGDEIVVGDWDCDGRNTPGVLRPATGEVFLFPDWADRTGDTVVGAAGQATGAVVLATGPQPCGPPALLDAEGRRLDVDLQVPGGAPS